MDEKSGAPKFSPSWATILRQCAFPNNAKYNYTKLGIVIEDDDVRDAAGEYFTNVFMANSALGSVLKLFGREEDAKNFISMHKSYDDIDNEVKTADQQPYCLALVFEKFEKDNYEVALRVPIKTLPVTSSPPYNSLIKAPDFASYN